jgi:hypothetical protein
MKHLFPGGKRTPKTLSFSSTLDYQLPQPSAFSLDLFPHFIISAEIDVGISVALLYKSISRRTAQNYREIGFL